MLQAQLFFERDELLETESQEDFILKFLIKHKMIGATVIRAQSGFGHNQLLKRPDMLFSFDEVPIIIIFVDEEEKVRNILTELKPLLKNCFIITSKVEMW